jgi:hypothetical protein
MDLATVSTGRPAKRPPSVPRRSAKHYRLIGRDFEEVMRGRNEFLDVYSQPPGAGSDRAGRRAHRAPGHAVGFSAVQDGRRLWDTSKPVVWRWFERADEQPFFFAGIWRPWTGDRGTKKVPNIGDHTLFSIMTTEPNAIVEPIHEKAIRRA